jgi:transcriptional regulator with XRE-family HTH domain
LSLSVENPPHKWHIWFFPTHKPTLKKPKEPFFPTQLKNILYFCQNRQDLIFKTMETNFGEYIRKLRTQNGWTLTQLGAKLGIDSGALSKIETGKKEFDEELLSNLADAFNLDYEMLKSELISEKIAKKLYQYQCNDNVLTLAEQKVKYIRSKNIKQTLLKF